MWYHTIFKSICICMIGQYVIRTLLFLYRYVCNEWWGYPVCINDMKEQMWIMKSLSGVVSSQNATNLHIVSVWHVMNRRLSLFACCLIMQNGFKRYYIVLYKAFFAQCNYIEQWCKPMPSMMTSNKCSLLANYETHMGPYTGNCVRISIYQLVCITIDNVFYKTVCMTTSSYCNHSKQLATRCCHF